MKKIISFILITALFLTMCVPVLAADDSRSTNLSFTYTPAEPSYNVTIPAEWYIDWVGGYNYYDDQLYANISVSEAENLGGQSVIITIDSTSQSEINGDYLRLKAYTDVSEGYSVFLRYSLMNQTLHSADFTVVHPETQLWQLGISGATIGSKIAEFNKDGTQKLAFFIDGSEQPKIQPKVNYIGTITFGISLGEGIVDWEW